MLDLVTLIINSNLFIYISVYVFTFFTLALIIYALLRLR